MFCSSPPISSYWFMLCFLPWLGITILPSFHGTPWPKFGRRKLSSRILWQLNRFMLLKYLKVMVVTSNDITRQINELLGYKSMSRIEIKRHFPTYYPPIRLDPASRFCNSAAIPGLFRRADKS